LTDDERGALAEDRNVKPDSATTSIIVQSTSISASIKSLASVAMFHKLLIPRVPYSSPLPSRSIVRTMATIRSSLSHEERTAQEPREARLEPVTVSRIDTVNDTIRLIRLSAMKPDHTLKVHISPFPTNPQAKQST
jgi:hypothetical protein